MSHLDDLSRYIPLFKRDVKALVRACVKAWSNQPEKMKGSWAAGGGGTVLSHNMGSGGCRQALLGSER